MAKYRTALGKVIDMTILQGKNEKTRAVGNMKVNARGDTIDSNGNIIKPATSKVNEAYSKTVGNRSAQPVRKQPRVGDQTPRQVAPKPQPKPVNLPLSGVNQMIPEPVEPVELTKEEIDLDRELDDDELAEQIKAMETQLQKDNK